MEAKSTDPGPIGVDGGQPATRPGKGGRIATSTGRIPGARSHPFPDDLDDLVEECPEVPAALLERVEQADACGSVTADQVIDERVHRVGIGEPEEIPDRRLIDPVGCRGQELVEHRLRVAHPARRQPGDQVDGLWIRIPAVRGQDAVELALDLGDREAPDVEALEAGEDGGREGRRLGRGEHEDDEVRRLLDRLEQGVPGRPGDLMRLVEDVDLSPELAGRVGQALP